MHGDYFHEQGEQAEARGRVRRRDSSSMGEGVPERGTGTAVCDPALVREDAMSEPLLVDGPPAYTVGDDLAVQFFNRYGPPAGERGPELALLPVGTNIVPAQQTQRLLSDAGGQGAGRGGGGGITIAAGAIQINVNDAGTVSENLGEEIAQELLAQGVSN